MLRPPARAVCIDVCPYARQRKCVLFREWAVSPWCYFEGSTRRTRSTRPPRLPRFVWFISHQPAVLFSQNKPAIRNQPAVLFSQNKPAPAISNQTNEQAALAGRSANGVGPTRVRVLLSLFFFAPQVNLWIAYLFDMIFNIYVIYIHFDLLDKVPICFFMCLVYFIY
jgi:hypothetical protein